MPPVRPAHAVALTVVIRQRISDRIIGDRLAVVACKQILPFTVAIAVALGFLQHLDRQKAARLLFVGIVLRAPQVAVGIVFDDIAADAALIVDGFTRLYMNKNLHLRNANKDRLLNLIHFYIQNKVFIVVYNIYYKSIFRIVNRFSWNIISPCI